MRLHFRLPHGPCLGDDYLRVSPINAITLGRRPLVILVFSFLGGLFLAEVFGFFPLLTTFAVGLLLIFDFTRSGRLPLSVILAGSLGFLLPPILGFSIRSHDLSGYVDRGPIRITARVASAPQHYPCHLRLRMESLSLQTTVGTQPLHGFFRLTLRTPETSLGYGDIIEVRVPVRSFQQFENPGVFAMADYLKRQGLAGSVTLPDEDSIVVRQLGKNKVLRSIYHYRDRIRQHLGAGHSGSDESRERTAPVGRCERGEAFDVTRHNVAGSFAPLHEGRGGLLAMTIGEPGFLTDTVQDLFTDSGTNHILSISGSHLAMIAWVVFGLSRAVLRRLPPFFLLRLSLYKIPSQWAALITVPAVTLYAFISGMAVATERSLIMILAYLLAVWFGRANDPLTALALAAFVIVVRHPTAIFDISFQLSFLAILFIILLMEGWEDHSPSAAAVTASGITRWTRPLTAMLLTSLGATLGTAPLTLYYFHQFSWVGFLANPILIPFVGFVVLPFGLISALVSPLLGGFPFLGVHDAIGSVYITMTRFFASLPGADFHFASPAPWGIFLFYGLLIVLLIRHASLRWMGITVTFFFVIFLGWGRIRIPPDNLKVTFLDVGQGDAALIEFPDGKTMLVDGGSGMPFDRGRRVIAPFLWEKKITTLDYLVGTHPQEDHMGGFPFLLERFHVKNILTNGITVPLPFYRLFLETAERKGLTPRGVTRGDPPLFISGCQVTFLHPQKTSRPDNADLNNHSVVFRLSCPPIRRAGGPGGATTFLFTGDIEEKGIREILKNKDNLQSDILKGPHHGSKSSLNARFVEQIAPRAVLFSAGRRNRYGHPHPAVVADYTGRGIQVYRTDQDGAVTVMRHHTESTVHSFRTSKRRRIQWSEAPFQEFKKKN